MMSDCFVAILKLILVRPLGTWVNNFLRFNYSKSVAVKHNLGYSSEPDGLVETGPACANRKQLQTSG
jgi:hypothetical protein